MKKILCSEEQYQSFQSQYGTHFDFDYFKKFTNFKDRIKYCNLMLKLLAKGSSRRVYRFNDDYVLKLAYNKKGLVQNETEITHFNYQDFSTVAAEIIDHDEDSWWLLVEFCKKCTEQDFERIIGMPFGLFLKYLNNQGRVEQKYEEIIESEFVVDMHYVYNGYNLLRGDFGRIDSYGINKNGEIVLVDYGLTNDDFERIYKH